MEAYWTEWGRVVWRWLRAFSLILGVGCAGCSIHPLPEDVTGVTTYDIVRQIRCETREALRAQIIKFLESWARHDDVIAQRLLLQYQSDPESISTFSASLFPGPEYVQKRAIIKVFADTGIAYNFDLQMTEDNDLTADVNFLRLPSPSARTKFTLGLKAGAKRRRNNTRVFTTTDTFRFLLTKLNVANVRGQRYCDGQIAHANYIYPITGRVGVDKVVHDFIELTLFANLAGKDGTADAPGAPTMADKLTFTTTINASVNPKIEFTPITNAFQFVSASADASVLRTDLHQVTVGLAIATSGMPELGPFRAYLFSPERGAGTMPATATRRSAGSGLYVGRRVTGGGTPSEVLAVITIDQLKSRELELIPPP